MLLELLYQRMASQLEQTVIIAMVASFFFIAEMPTEIYSSTLKISVAFSRLTHPVLSYVPLLR